MIYYITGIEFIQAPYQNKTSVCLYELFGVQNNSIVTFFQIADWQDQGNYDFLYANRNGITLVVDCILVMP